LGAHITSVCNFEIELRNIILAAPRVFEFSHTLDAKRKFCSSSDPTFRAHIAPIRSTSQQTRAAGGLLVSIISGFLPFGVAALNTCFANLYSGLWYLVVCSAVAAVIGFVAMPEPHKNSL
jgi:hypothetical protein